MEKQKNILIICGEASGDLNAANLSCAIKEINPYIKISGVGGTLMRQSQTEVFYDIKGLAVIGLFDVLKKLPKFFALKKLILEKIKKDKIDAIILVDFSGFNLRLAQAINNSIPVIYYVSPQVWASRKGRLKTIKKYVRKMIVLFKFEEEFYKEHGIDVDFAGHPLLDIVRPTIVKREFLNKYQLCEDKTTIALLPGSRKAEIKNILPLMLKTAILIKKKIGDIQFIVAKSSQVDWDIYNRIICKFCLDLKVVEDKTYDCLEAADFCLVASGTATLETTIMQKPFFVIYKMGLLNYLLYRPQIKVPYIGMVNIVAKDLIAREFIQFKAVPKNISIEAIKIIEDPNEMERLKNRLKQIKRLLGEKGAVNRAARIILEFLENAS